MEEQTNDWTESAAHAGLIVRYGHVPEFVCEPNVGWPASLTADAIDCPRPLWRAMLVLRLAEMPDGTRVDARGALRYLRSQGVDGTNTEYALIAVDGYLTHLRSAGVLGHGPGQIGFATATTPPAEDPDSLAHLF